MPFKQTATGFADALTVGGTFTITVTVADALHPAALVPITVYVVVVVGLAVTVAPVVALNPVAGDQPYVIPPEAVNETPVLPKQIDGADGDTAIVGFAFTVMAYCGVVANAPPFAQVILAT